MKLSFLSLSIEAETVQDVQALLSLAVPYLSSSPVPSRSSAAPGIITDRERSLRDAYREHYGKGFTMKGRDGSPLSVLESLESAGWPSQAGAFQDDSLESAPSATVQDDGESFV